MGGGWRVTQNLLLGWAAGLQLVRELCGHLWNHRQGGKFRGARIL